MEENQGTSGAVDMSTDVVESQDFTSSFKTDTLFATREELLTWVRAVGKSLGMVIVIGRFDTGRRSGKQYCMLICDKAGSYKANVEEGTNTRKCCCPFRLKGKFIKKLGGWILRVMDGTHNHGLTTYHEGRPYIGRLTSEENELVTRMTRNHTRPKLIINELKLMKPDDNYTVVKQIYNCRQKQRSAMREGRTELQQLMFYLQRDNYVYWTRLAEGTTVVKDIFWAHPDSIELLNTFPVVLLIDSTYKTNRYRYPLVEIVGVTSTEKTYSAAFAYVNWERMDNFAWVLEKLRGLFRKQNELPQVILTDRDTGMMNALAAIFPTSANLLCQFHIKKNVRAKARLIVKDQAIVNDIMGAFQSVVHAKSTEDYDLELGLFNDLAGPYPSFIQYVKITWLDPFKEKFIDAWINKHMHLGNTTTNRVESAHSHLKQILRDSRGDLCKCWDGMQTMLRIQHSDLKMHFEHSLSRVKVHHLKKKIFDEIKGLVSSNAIDHILDEMQQTGSVSLNPSLCRCTLGTTHGLPCACELSRVMMDCTPIPLSMIHQHWQRLNFKIQTEVVDDELSLDIELEAIKRRFEASDHAGRVMMKAKARELAFPDTTSMCPPPDTITTKGAPKKDKKGNVDHSTKRDKSYWEHVDNKFDSGSSSGCFAQSRKRPTPPQSRSGTPTNPHSSGSTPTPTLSTCPAPNPLQSKKRTQAATATISTALTLTPAPALTPNPIVTDMDAAAIDVFNTYIIGMPEFMRPYVEKIVNVVGDGNCGFRCIAAFLGRGEEAWQSVRTDLMDELNQYNDFYTRL